MQGFRFGLLVSCVLGMGVPAANAKFLQTDPVGYQDQMNLYAYCANDPLNCTDPTGMVRTDFNNINDAIKHSTDYVSDQSNLDQSQMSELTMETTSSLNRVTGSVNRDIDSFNRGRGAATNGVSERGGVSKFFDPKGGDFEVARTTPLIGGEGVKGPNNGSPAWGGGGTSVVATTVYSRGDFGNSQNVSKTANFLADTGQTYANNSGSTVVVVVRGDRPTGAVQEQRIFTITPD